MDTKQTIRHILLSQYGEPENLHLMDTPLPKPGPGQVLIKVEAAGMNNADTLRRRNIYFMPTPLPYVPGSEVVGTVEEVGEYVDLPTGIHVLAILPDGGGYAEYTFAQAEYCVPLPPHIGAAQATALFVQGTTA